MFREFRTCEFSTLTRDGVPVAWPLISIWRPEEGRFLLTTSIGLPREALNIRRDPRVSLLFSDPTASGLECPPAVLVQGDAEVTGRVITSPAGFEDYWERILRVQPAGEMYGANWITRRFMDWYYIRLYISVRPRRVLLWPEGDFERTPEEVDRVVCISKYLPMFDSAVVSFADAEGYPYSARCHPLPDRPAGVLRLARTWGKGLRPGPASMLCHSHDNQTWNQRTFVLRGTLGTTGTDGRFARKSSFRAWVSGARSTRCARSSG